MATEVTLDELEDAIKRGLFVLDVREQNEWDAGYLHGATHAPKGMISFTIANTYCNYANAFKFLFSI